MLLFEFLQVNQITKGKIRVALFESLFFLVFFLYRSNDTSFSDEDRPPSEHLTHCQGSSVCVFRLMISLMIAFIVSARTTPVSLPNENRGSFADLTDCQVSPKISFSDTCVLMRSTVVPNNVLWFGTRIRSVHRLFERMFQCSKVFHEGT